MIEKMAEEYCLYGFKYQANKYNQYDFVDEKTAYTFDDNMQPTRDVNSAKVIMLDRCLCSSIDLFGYQQLNIKWNGFSVYLIKKEDLETMLNRYPPPRKSISKTVRSLVYSKYNGKCGYCGCDLKFEEMQVDHLVAHLCRGGEDSLENYMPACVVCNRKKSNLTLDDFRYTISHCGEVHRKRKKPAMYDSDKIAIKYGLTEGDKKIIFYYEKENE